ncbi:MAG: dienelactone hydrolase family protein [Bryobacteraceae bacterium]
MCRPLAAALFVLSAAASLWAQPYTTGPQAVTFASDADDTDQPYGLYVPRNFDPARKYPLVIMLHDVSSNHRLALRRVFGRPNRPGETDADANRFFPNFRDVNYIVASPLARGTLGYQGLAEKDVYDVVADVKRRFAIDDDRIFLTGIGMGGGGALWLGLTRPDFWAAIAPVCPAPPPGTEELAGNALNIPVKLYQGEIDPAVKAEQTRRWSQQLLDAGVKVEYIEYPGVRHNAGDFAYKDASIFSVFDPYRRNPLPDHVNFSTADYQHASAYWVQFDQLTPGTLATIDVRFEGANKLKITTKSLTAFTLNLKGHPMMSKVPFVNVVLDGAAFRQKAQGSLSFTREPKGWVAKHSAPLPSQKGPGQEGPISRAIASRQIYVYGTGGSVSPDDLIWRRNQANAAAEWSTPRARLMITNRVIPDAEVSDYEMKSANLILFGTSETNSVIARLAPRLPLHLNPGAADYGLVYVAPIGGRHYAVISSGLSWWTRADQSGRPGLTRNPAPYRALETFQDFILFKGGLDNVITEGYFDRDWKLPAAAASKMRDTGAVTLP